MLWRTFTDSLLHPALRAPEIAWKARFLIECLVVGACTAGAFAIAYGLIGLSSAVPTGVGSILLAGCALSLRWVRQYEPVAWISMLVCLFVIGYPSVMEPALDPAVLAYVTVIPYVAALLLKPSQAIGFALLCLAVMFLFLVVRQDMPVVAPDQTLSVARASGLVFTIFVFGLRFSREQGRALSELGAASRAKSAFLATMSHEIRTPMNGVLGVTEELLSGPLDADTREKLALVRESGRTLVGLVNDILDYSKIEAGKVAIEPVDFDVRVLFDDVTGLHRPSARLKGVSLVVDVAAQLPPVLRMDAMRLRQVLNNLISNAVKFTERGEVRVTLAPLSSDRLEVKVVDTGIGIPAEVQTRLFTPFEQGDGSTTRRFGGTGLGLALSRNFVQLMGGVISFESVQGVGSTFRIELPFQVGVAALVEDSRSQPLIARSLLPVLVVDDNAVNLKVACSLVERAGYRTDTAANGQEALEKVLRSDYLLVLMDCHMPVMDGFVATEKIRGLDSELAMLPVVALTASALPEELEACKRAGMNDCLVKPVSLRAVEAMMQRVEHYRRILEGTVPPLEGPVKRTGS
jgi:signal transduction histidine kinase/ActR/RegA family two-component response regulator